MYYAPYPSPMKTIDPSLIRQIFVLLLIVLIGGLIAFEMIPYLSGVLGTITMYVILTKPMKWLVGKGWNQRLAVVLLMFASFIMILMPVSGAILMLGNKIGNAVKNSKKVVSALKGQVQELESYVGFKFIPDIDATGTSDWLSDSLQGLAGGTFNTLIAISIMYFLLYYMMTNRTKLQDSLFKYVPMSDENLKLIGNEVTDIVRANALGIPLVALAQGTVALIGFLIFGVESPFFWAVIVTIVSMIPFVVNFLGTIPVFILALSNGNTFQAWGILLYGIVVVGSTDNLIRLYVLKKLDNVHPLITLIGVIVGIPLFGFIGLIFGPLLVNLFLVVLYIYRREYGKKDEEQL